eukprot:s2501_g1.t1
MPGPARDLDVHSHVQYLQQQIASCLPSSSPHAVIKLKHTMSAATWVLVQSKRAWRTTLHEAQTLQKNTLMHTVFAAWKVATTDPSGDHHDAMTAQFDQLLRDQDLFIAKALFEFRNLGRQVTAASRFDDKAFYQALLGEGADHLLPHQIRELWKVIKRTLPKHQQKRQGVDPLRLMRLEDAWGPHFEQLEAGCPIAADAIVREVSTLCDPLRHVDPPAWHEVPTLFDLEHVLRKNKTGRATGFDPFTSGLYHSQPAALAEHAFSLLLKTWLWAEEPIQFKGGPMALLPKRPQPTAAQHFRGILLLPTLAKGFHALLRRQIMAILHSRRHPGQRGGFTQQEVLYGSQHFSVGVLFVDLSTAFHCLVREMVVGASQYLFLQRGFILNLAKGKTGVVATFCGPSAPALRREFQLTGQPGVAHCFPDGHSAFVHFSPAYRHLGTLYTSDQQLNAEISARIGAATSAFVQVSRRLLLNRHLPRKLCLQLFGSLILSKLYFAMGSWHTPTGRQVDRLRTALVRMVRKIVDSPPGPHGRSAAEVLVDAGLPDPRVRLAVDRLLYAQRLFHHGPEFLQTMIHAEVACHAHPWLEGLRHDLRWLYSVEAVPDERLLERDHTNLIDAWQASSGVWKGRIKRACQRHIFQESMILEAQQWHAQIFDVLRTHAYTFRPDPAVLHLQDGIYPCPECSRTFTTPQGVHTHRRRAHGVYCLEHHLLDSATCPACMRFLWSTQRLQQHLSYMPRSGVPNPCYAFLPQIDYAVTYSAVALPSVFRGQSRLDALVTEGPLWAGPTLRDRTLRHLEQERVRLQAEYCDFVAPDDVLTADQWIDVLCRLPEHYESWASRTFLVWGEHLLPDFLAEILDGEAEYLIEEAFSDLAGDLHEYQLAARLRQLDLCIRRHHDEASAPSVPHRPVRPPQQDCKPRSVPQQTVGRLFEQQEKWQNDLRQVAWDGFPSNPCTPMIRDLMPRPSFLIVHLFSGRRRHHDLHARLDAWAQRRNFDLTILSLDTAVAPVLGNLDQQSDTWGRLRELYLSGFVAASISGHPCETFSSARWHPPPAEFQHLHWPRPLRTAMNLFGIDHRTLKELFQTKIGTMFFLQTIWVLACHVSLGGLFIEEHPGVPRQEHHPSVWRSAIVQFFCKHLDIVLHHIRQWRFGASSVKPTGLLALRLPHFARDLYHHALPEVTRPETHAIGVDGSGQFRTSCHKEYPSALSAGLANALAQERTFRARTMRMVDRPAPQTCDWLLEVHRACAVIRDSTTWLPDFQGGGG